MEDLSVQSNMRVMRRVRRIYRWRTYARPFVLDVAALAALVGCTAFFVSLANFARNMTSSFSAGFFIEAFAHTELLVKLISVLILAAAVLLVRHMYFTIMAVIGFSRSSHVADSLL